MKKIGFVLVTSLIYVSLNAQSASFDCKNASTSVEVMICKDDDLGRFDEILAKNYKEIRNLSTDKEIVEIKATQRQWIKKRNEVCNAVVSCVDLYAKRIVELKKNISSKRLKSNLLKYKNMNQLVWDRDFNDFTNQYFGNYKSKMLTRNKSLASEEVSEVLGGPPRDLEIKNNLVIGEACRAHSCPEKGIVIFDKNSLDSIFGVIHYINKNGDISKDPILSIFYKDKSFLDRNLELLKNKTKERSDFKKINILEIKS